MYTPAHFKESRLPELHKFIRSHPLGSIVTQAAGRLDANHIPLLLDPGMGPFGILRGHVARVNPVWRETGPEAEVLVLFHGPGSYVSPGFYPSKQEHGKVVPTWNYAVVHARGKLKLSQNRSAADRAGVRSGLQRSGDADAVATAGLMGESGKGTGPA